MNLTESQEEQQNYSCDHLVLEAQVYMIPGELGGRGGWGVAGGVYEFNREP